MQAVEAQLIFDDPNTETNVARLVLYNVSSATTWCALELTYAAMSTLDTTHHAPCPCETCTCAPRAEINL